MDCESSDNGADIFITQSKFTEEYDTCGTEGAAEACLFLQEDHNMLLNVSQESGDAKPAVRRYNSILHYV